MPTKEDLKKELIDVLRKQRDDAALQFQSAQIAFMQAKQRMDQSQAASLEAARIYEKKRSELMGIHEVANDDSVFAPATTLGDDVHDRRADTNQLPTGDDLRVSKSTPDEECDERKRYPSRRNPKGGRIVRSSRGSTSGVISAKPKGPSGGKAASDVGTERIPKKRRKQSQKLPQKSLAASEFDARAIAVDKLTVESSGLKQMTPPRERIAVVEHLAGVRTPEMGEGDKLHTILRTATRSLQTSNVKEPCILSATPNSTGIFDGLSTRLTDEALHFLRNRSSSRVTLGAPRDDAYETPNEEYPDDNGTAMIFLPMGIQASSNVENRRVTMSPPKIHLGDANPRMSDEGATAQKDGAVNEAGRSVQKKKKRRRGVVPVSLRPRSK